MLMSVSLQPYQLPLLLYLLYSGVLTIGQSYTLTCTVMGVVAIILNYCTSRYYSDNCAYFKESSSW